MIYDLIIIGGGPAGITAGIYAARQKLKTLLITKSFGGQMAKKAVPIENYPGFEKISGLNLIKKFEKHLKNQDIKIKQTGIRKVKKSVKNFLVETTDKNFFKAKSVIVASGADPRPLEVPGEKKFIGRGVSYCTTCDAPLFANKKVAVIGGGNSGLEAAIFLAEWVKKVYILEYAPEIMAEQAVFEKVKKIGKIEIITSVNLKKVQGNNFVQSIIYQNRGAKKNILLEVDGIFVEIGYQPATSFVKGLVNFNKKDEIIADPKTMQTKTPGLFAAGDVSDVVYKQIVIAAGEGCKAVLSVSNYLHNL
jgi:NADH-dependent peroxiredoxin subunit F